MITVRKSKARSPLAVGKPIMSYGMSNAVNDGMDGITLHVDMPDEIHYITISLDDDQLDKIVTFRDQCKATRDQQRERFGS